MKPRSEISVLVLIGIQVVGLAVGLLFTLLLVFLYEGCPTEFCNSSLTIVIVGAIALQVGCAVAAITMMVRRRPAWWGIAYVTSLSLNLLIAWQGGDLHDWLQRFDPRAKTPTLVEISTATSGPLSSPTQLLDVAGGASGLVLVGGWPNYGIWVSEDGVNWQGIEFEGLGRLASPEAVAPVGNGFAVGGWAPGGTTIWKSDNARSWTRTVVDALSAGTVYDLTETGWEAIQLTQGLGDVESITTFGDGLVAVGSSAMTDESPGQFGLVWDSSDGQLWSTPVGFGNLPDVALFDVVTGQDGLMAVGVELSEGYEPIALVSIDAQEWIPAIEGLPSQGGLMGVAAGQGHFVAVGDDYGDDDRKAFIVFSEDGTEWKAAAIPESLDITRLHAVTYIGDRWIAVGEARGNPCDCVVLESLDGLVWSVLTP